MVNALAIDLGTTACKASVVSIDGAVLGSGLAPLDTVFGPGGAAWQDAELMWAATLDACRQALAEAGAPITLVSVAAQWSSIVPVDRLGQPVAPMNMWFDRRGERFADALTDGEHAGARARWSDVHGFAPSTSLAHILWFQHDESVRARTAAYLEPADYLNARFTGRIATTANTAMPLALSDNRSLGAICWSDELIGLAGVDRDTLPPLVPSLTVLGPMLDDVADALGLPHGVDVTTGSNDSVASAFGSGAIEPGVGTIMMGTTGVLVVHHPQRYVDTDRFVVTMPSAIEDRYYVVAEGGLGGKLIELALSQASGLDGRPPDDDAFDRFAAAAARSAPGANGVLFLPWAFGALAPAPDARHRAALLGMSMSTTRADVARAMLEGISMQMRWLADEVEEATGTAFSTIRFVGGGARFDLWARIMADVVGRPIEQVENPRHANARGAGLMGFVATGRLAIDDLAGLVPIRATYEPDPATHGLFADRLAIVRGLHSTLADPVARLTTRPAPAAPSPNRSTP